MQALCIHKYINIYDIVLDSVRYEMGYGKAHSYHIDCCHRKLLEYFQIQYLCLVKYRV